MMVHSQRLNEACTLMTTSPLRKRTASPGSAIGAFVADASDVVLHHHPQGDGRVPEQRKRLVLRNRLWTMWLRRSPGRAFRATWRPIDRYVEKVLDAMTELPA